MTKRKSWIILSILCAVIGGIPFIVGIYLEKAIKNYVSQTYTSDVMSIAIKTYDRSIFSSNVAIDIYMMSYSNKNGETAITDTRVTTIYSEVSHGPILFSTDGISFAFGSAKSTLQIPSLDKIADIDVSQNTFTWNSKIRFSGIIDTRFTLPTFSIGAKEYKDGLQISINDMDIFATQHLFRNKTDIKDIVECDIASISVAGNADVTLTNISFDSAITFSKNDLITNDLYLEIGNLNSERGNIEDLYLDSVAYYQERTNEISMGFSELEIPNVFNVGAVQMTIAEHNVYSMLLAIAKHLGMLPSNENETDGQQILSIIKNARQNKNDMIRTFNAYAIDDSDTENDINLSVYLSANIFGGEISANGECLFSITGKRLKEIFDKNSPTYKKYSQKFSKDKSQSGNKFNFDIIANALEDSGVGVRAHVSIDKAIEENLKRIPNPWSETFFNLGLTSGALVDTGSMYESFMYANLHLRGINDYTITYPSLNHYSLDSSFLRRPFSKDSEILISTWMNDTESLSKLLEEGGDAKMEYRNARHPLHHAAMLDNADIMELLLSHGVAVDQKDYTERTALHVATIADNEKAVLFLLSQKASINERDINGRSALSIAAEKGYVNIVKILLENNADKDMVDFGYKSALQYATENAHTEIIQMLSSK